MNPLDYLVLIGVMVGIAAYGIWRTRAKGDLHSYLKGEGHTHWFTIGLSVMATQASAITFLSTPGQGYESGLGFVQNYFGAPLALLLIAAVFLPIYRRLKVYTAYEYLGKRFDSKTRLLGAGLFLIQRGMGAGITIYAPAIVLSTVMGWRLDATILCSGLLVVAYTVSGGSAAVNLTQKYQIGVIFLGMATAFVVLLLKLPAGLGFTDAIAVAGGYHKLEAVDFSLDPDRRYTIWTGVLGGMFLALSYFGTDQSQVQRYLSGTSLRESRLGLMFNAVFKIPMQLCILLLGALVFVFYQFERPPVFFNQSAWHYAATHGSGDRLRALEHDFNAAHAEKQTHVRSWLAARHAGDPAAAETARTAALAAHARTEAARVATKAVLKAADAKAPTNDSDYVFITFILSYLPHGLIGLLVAVIFAATFSSKAGELNALGSTTVIDFYRHLVRTDATDKHYVVASKIFTALWGFVAIGFALFANLAENLIQATNIVGSIFYGVVLGLFLVAFFLKRVGGTAVFWAAVISQALVFLFYATLSISYLWYNVVGCALCMVISVLIQFFLPRISPLDTAQPAT
ncbi:MAG: sodium:solute symporter [Opitutae bacterium]|nr:sodium:solute symporter [Opitutae bacterium]